MGMKKAVHLAMVAMLIGLLIAGCSSGSAPNGNNGNEGNTTGSTSSSSASESSSATADPPAEPVEISIFMDSSGTNFPNGVQTDPVAQEIEKRLGIKLNVTTFQSVADPTAKISAMLASGELTDIMPGGNGEQMPKFVATGYPLVLDPYAELMPNILNLTVRVDYSRERWSMDALGTDGKSDGKLRFIGMGGEKNSDPLQVRTAPYLRWDLYAKLGYPKIEKLDDYLPILQQMMELEPTNSAGQKNYALGYRFGDGYYPFIWILLSGYVGMWGYNIEPTLLTQHDIETFDSVPAITDPASPVWEVISFWNKAHRMGLVDPDSYIQKNDQYLEKLNSNRYFMMFAPNPTGQQLFISEGTPDKGYYQMPSPVSGATKYYATYSDPYGNNQYFISKNSKHPEKAVELLDYLTSYEGTELIYNGIEGVSWDIVDGKPTIKPEYVEMYINDPDFKAKTGIGKYAALAGRGQAMIDPEYGVGVNFFLHADVLEQRLDQVQKAGIAHYGVQYPAETILKAHEVTDKDNRPSWPSFPDNILADRQKAMAYWGPEVIRAITAGDDNAFAAVKQELIDYASTQLNAAGFLEWLEANQIDLPPLNE